MSFSYRCHWHRRKSSDEILQKRKHEFNKIKLEECHRKSIKKALERITQ